MGRDGSVPPRVSVSVSVCSFCYFHGVLAFLFVLCLFVFCFYVVLRYFMFVCFFLFFCLHFVITFVGLFACLFVCLLSFVCLFTYGSVEFFFVLWFFRLFSSHGRVCVLFFFVVSFLR